MTEYEDADILNYYIFTFVSNVENGKIKYP